MHCTLVKYQMFRIDLGWSSSCLVGLCVVCALYLSLVKSQLTDGCVNWAPQSSAGDVMTIAVLKDESLR